MKTTESVSKIAKSKNKTFGVILDENDTMRLNFFLQKNDFPPLESSLKQC